MRNPDIIRFKEELRINIESFLAGIKNYCREGFDHDLNAFEPGSSGFPILALGDSSYYISKSQHEFQEGLVRHFLVNNSLKYLFKYYGYDVRWRSVSVYDLCTNQKYEEFFPFQFLVIKDDVRVAYRYTPITSDYTIPGVFPVTFDLSLQSMGIQHPDKWVSIEWNEDDHGDKLKSFYGSMHNEKKRESLVYISIKQLFEQYFTLEEYIIFIDEIKKAVQIANGLLGFQTIPKLSPNNWGLFKARKEQEIEKICLTSLVYLKVNKQGDALSDEAVYGLTKDDTELLIHNFIRKSRYLTLVGTNDYATSFLTSEYLFDAFQNGASIDYTSVVCGYIKSVEQLCASIINNFIVPRYDERVYIPMKPIKDKKRRKAVIEALNKTNSHVIVDEKYDYISMKQDNKEFFNTTLTLNQMIHFFFYNRQIVFGVDSEQSFPIIYECMNNYCSFDRNGYFHKHNITSIDTAKRIKNNTFIILFWLLGATNMYDSIEKNYAILGIVDNSFDRLFRKIAYRKEYRYIIKTSDGITRKAIRILEVPEYEINTYGHIQNAELFFYEVNNFPSNRYEYDQFISSLQSTDTTITVRRDHMPKEMYLLDHSGREIKLL